MTYTPDTWLAKKYPHIEARPYQVESWVKLWQSRSEGRQRALVSLATGLGKTMVAAVDAIHYLEEERPGAKILFVSHMNDISLQARATFKMVNPAVATQYYKKDGPLAQAAITFATFQALYQALESIPQNSFDYIIYDEAHHIEAETFKAVREHFTARFELGLTATPERADGLDIFEYFGDPLYTKGLAAGMAEGWLSAVDYHIVFDEEVKKAINNNFNFTTLKQIRSLFQSKVRNEQISKEVLQRRHNIGMDAAKTIVFCQNISAATEMAGILHGEVYHSNIGAADRRNIMERFRSGKLQVICTVDMFNEGIDIPDARLVVFLRSTSSRTIFEQQLGRGLRRSEGKDYVTVLDFVANVERIDFVRELGHTVSKHRGQGAYSGYNQGRSATTSQPLTFASHFEFEDQSIELLKRYNAIKGAESLTRDQVVAAYQQLGSVSAVAQQFSVSTTAIYKHLRKAGIDTSGHLKQKADLETIVKTYFAVKSANKAAKILGLSAKTVLDKVRLAGYSPYKRPTQKYSDEELLAAYKSCDSNLRATERLLKQPRQVIALRLRKLGVDTSRKTTPAITAEQLAQVYKQYDGDIYNIVNAFNQASWVDVYRALDRYGYLSPTNKLTSAIAAAAYYKYGTSVRAGAALGVSSSYISRLAKRGKYIKRYNRGRKEVIV